MDDLRLHAVVARVVAWHNSHPLARRITAAQVNSVGYVALPYTAPGLPAPQALPPPEPAPEPVEPVELVEPVEPVEPVAPVEIDPVIETEDAGGIVIDVDSERQADPLGDSAAMTLEVELPAAATDDAPLPDPPPGQEADIDPQPVVEDGTGAPDPQAPSPPAAPERPTTALRARAVAGQGEGPAPPAAGPEPGAPRTLVCSEDFMLPIPVKKVLEWVHTHGVALPHDPGDGPVRQVPVDAALLPAGAGVGQLWVATAAIELGGHRHRVLLGGGAEPAVLGRRAWSRPRLLAVLAAPAVLLVALLVWLMWPAAPAVALPIAVEAAEPAASAASAASAAASSALAASASASAPEPGASAPSAHSDTPSADTVVPRLPGLLDEAAKAEARATVAALRAQRQASAPATPAAAPAAVATAKPPAPAPVAEPAPPPAVLYGLSTRLLRTRAEAEQLQSAFQTLLGGTPGSTLRVEMLPAGEDWRVVCWPFERRADAERARALLQARGLRVELVDF